MARLTHLIPTIFQAARQAFGTEDVQGSLDAGRRVHGSLTVAGSPLYDELDRTRQYRLFWRHLILLLGPQAVHVGPIRFEDPPQQAT